MKHITLEELIKESQYGAPSFDMGQMASQLISSLFPEQMMTSVPTFVNTIASDPEINALITEIVDKAIKESNNTLFEDNKQNYVTMIKSIITDGATSLIEKFNQEKAQKSGKQSLVQNIDRENKVAGILDYFGDWASDKLESLIDGVKNFLNIKGATELVPQLVDLSIKKGLPKEYRNEFINYIDKSIQEGFQKVEQTVENKKEKEGKGENKGVETDTWKPNLRGQKASIFVAAENRFIPAYLEGGINPKDNTVWVWNMETSSKQWVPYPTVYNADQKTPFNITALGENPGAPGSEKQQVQTQQPDIQATQATPTTQTTPTTQGVPAEEQKQYVPGYPAGTVPGPFGIPVPYKGATSMSKKDKFASELMNEFLQYDPISCEVVGEFLIRSGQYQDGTKIFNGMDKFAGILEDILKNVQKVVNTDNIEKVESVAKKIFEDKNTSLVLQILGVKNPEELIKNISGVGKELKNIGGGLASFLEEKTKEKSQPEENATEEDFNLSEEELNLPKDEEDDATIDAEYTKVNSEVFLISKKGSVYADIEKMMEKVASENMIDGIQEIEIEVTKESCEVTFRKKQADAPAYLPMIASVLASRNIGQEESWFATGAKAAEAGLTNTGAVLGQVAAKYLGFGTAGQLIGGGLGALAWYFAFKKDTPKGKEMIKESMQGTLSDPSTKNIYDNIKSTPGNEKLSDVDLMPLIYDFQAKLARLNKKAQKSA